MVSLIIFVGGGGGGGGMIPKRNVVPGSGCWLLLFTEFHLIAIFVDLISLNVATCRSFIQILFSFGWSESRARFFKKILLENIC